MRTYSRKKVEYQVIEGVKEMCRLCLEKCEEVVPIFTDNSDVCAALPMRIMICVGLEMVREDCLPNMICQTCFKELERYYTFRKKCEVTYQKLKAHTMAIKDRELNKFKVEDVKKDMEGMLQPVEIHLENGDVDGQLVLALNENKQLELVNVVGLNGVVQKLDELSSSQVLQQDIKHDVQMQDISTTSRPASNDAASDATSDMSLLVSSILLRLGVLQRGPALRLAAPGRHELQLEAADGGRVTMELVEEGDEPDATSMPIVYQEEQPVTEDEIKLVMEVAEPVPSVTDTKPKTKRKTTKVAKTDAEKQSVAKSPRGASSDAWCSRCNKSFSTRSVLARHQRAHADLRPHGCGTCGRTFAQRAVLVRHELVHSEQRPFPCAWCPKSFTQRASLRWHARAHAPPHARPLALHRCGLCPKVFLYPSGLSRHMTVHEGRVYTCDVCRRQFKDKSALLRHLKNTDHNKMAT